MGLGLSPADNPIPNDTPIPAARPPQAGREIRSPLREALRKPLSDEELLRTLQAEEVDTFYIDPSIIPNGLVYEWKRHEVYGKDDKSYEAELLRRGWVPVMAEEHPGYFVPYGNKGHVLRQGQGLYKMDATEYQNRQRYNQLMAKRQVSDQEKVLGIAPQGTFNRPLAKVTTNYEAHDVE